MSSALESEFDEEMLNVYRRAKSEAGYNAQRFLQMVVDHGGVSAARILIRSDSVSDGFTALWERNRLDLTVEAVVLENAKYHSLFTEEERRICADRLKEYRYHVR